MNEKKITKKEMFIALRGMVEGVDKVGDIAADDVLIFIDKQVALLDKKSEQAREKAAKRRAEGDELQAAVKAVLTKEFQSANDILAQIEGEGLTKSKIIPRLTNLIDAGEAIKEQIKDEGSKSKIMKYRLA